MPEDIPLFEIAWDEKDVKNAVDSITRGGYWAKGPYVSEFEDEIEEYLGTEHAVTVNSGTSALVVALRSLGVGDGDEVVVPSFTFIATANSVKITGAEPVFADVDPETFALDPEAVEAQITEDTAAVLTVHPYGRAGDLEGLLRVTDRHDVPLVEDAAETFGATHEGEYLGTFGDVAALSFCQNKVITTGEGGAVITDDDDIAAEAELFRSHGRASGEYFQSAGTGQYSSLGSNLRMSDLVASIGCAQIDKVEDLIERRRDVAMRLNDGFEDIEGVTPHPQPENGRHVYQLYTVQFDEWVDREYVVKVLDDHGISSKVYWDPPVHATDYYRGEECPSGDLSTTEIVASTVLSLPMHPNLSVESTDRIVDAVGTALENEKR
ncbi:DegT/DnrJ/EryC1/StrS family aminotransferase [Halobaculum sp. MBLA0147]|uniref:DegT/DnrJ/EryC1/StrS family aminotransferase n=1 Tax=Halobaculum sp. MBLA0147 TaxID=3079934 RepID=UPI003526395F